MEPIYTLKDIEVTLSKKFTLQVPQLALGKGQIHVVTGPNGAGKSTLLNCLALLRKPQVGSVQFAGHPVNGKTRQLLDLRRKITLVEQSPYLLQGTIQSNLAFGLKLRAISKEEQQQRITDALNRVGLKGFSIRSVKDLSGGEIQRVALARALVLRPEVLLLDEPTANIDADSMASFENLLLSLPATGMTIILSTHDQAQVLRLGGNLIVIENGLVQEKKAVPEP
ncbi:MAG: energy-coupling factor ABC transporter ATP-binding protein [Deltaproteobacteria bacterium]|jgi:tungstate transport system ATP-binding protein|nr:energy-coupling factor ABC transporter ATP-binding protein [Deltaproteobacteria bacterium]MCW8892676.1 energy-coupling factor ABC transporter ATP-binding protein [Deltaproteobacteria bacterium]MCW9050470.1 energy-coupling factor ABC transporter ATP-binding protein [Deltaproteobacteria bacterium]